MATVHKLLLEHGKQGTLAFDLDRRVVDAAADYLADEEGGVGYIYSGFAQAALPHKKLKDDAVWQVRTEHVLLMVQPGLRPTREGDPIPIGVPYGSRARLILLYLMTQALRTNSREVELGGSLREWMERMGIPVGGPTARVVRDQAERLSRCRLSFQVSSGGKTGLLNQNLVDGALFLDEEIPGKGMSFSLDRVRLSESFWEQLRKHPIPLDEAAIRALQGHSMALDLYCWLAYRLHVLQGSRPVSWTALKAQFGTGFSRMDHFKPTFVENLNLAMAVYPEAKVDVGDKGVTLLPSSAPISPKVHAIKAIQQT
jgi:Plasmid encoded RepA protein